MRYRIDILPGESESESEFESESAWMALERDVRLKGWKGDVEH